MFSNIRKIIARHSRKLIVSGAIVGGLVFISKYSQYKLNEWRKQEVQQVLQRSRRTQHFESTERSCNQMIMNLAGSIRMSVLKSLDSEQILNDLKNESCDKIVGWNQLKILSISKPVAIIYTHVMFVFTMKIQLNLISAHMFKNSQKNGEIVELDEVVKEKYLSMCSYFMDEGVLKLTEFIKQKVEEVIKSISLTDKLRIKDVEQLQWSIMSSILADETHNPVKNLTKYMLSMSIGSETNDSLSKIINVTIDLLESEEVQSLMQSCIRSGLVQFIDRISQYFYEQIDNCNTNISTNTNMKKVSLNKVYENSLTRQVEPYFNLREIAMPMAKLIPIFEGQVQNLPTSHDFHHDWLHTLMSDEKLKIFSANIYEAFSF